MDTKDIKLYDEFSKEFKVYEDSLLFNCKHTSNLNSDDLIIYVENTIKCIKNSTNPREIIFETWFLIDSCIRNSILSAFNLLHYNSDDYDLRFKLLPSSFDGCLNFLKELISTQRYFWTNKDPYDNEFYTGVNLDIRFRLFLINNHKDFLNEFYKLIDEFHQKFYPKFYEKELKQRDLASYLLEVGSCKNIFEMPCKVIPKSWIDSMSRIDTSWFEKVKYLNKTRNAVAHRYDTELIFFKFKCKGDNRLEQLKSKILILIENLIGINIEI